MPLTVLGQAHHTVAELQDLLAKDDHLILMMYAAYAPRMADVAVQDPTWLADWGALQNRYSAAKDQATKAISNARLSVGTPNQMIPAEAAFQALAKATKQNPDRITKGDLQDLSNRLMNLGISPDYSGTPQPRWGSDLDQIIRDALKPLTIPLDAAEKKLKDLFDDNPVSEPTHYPKTWLLAILGVIGGILGLRWASRTVSENKKYALPALNAAATLQPELIPIAIAADTFHKSLPTTAVVEEKKP